MFFNFQATLAVPGLGYCWRQGSLCMPGGERALSLEVMWSTRCTQAFHTGKPDCHYTLHIHKLHNSNFLKISQHLKFVYNVVLSSINGYPQLKAAALHSGWIHLVNLCRLLNQMRCWTNTQHSQTQLPSVHSTSLLASCALQYQIELKQFAHSKDRGTWKLQAWTLELTQAVWVSFFSPCWSQQQKKFQNPKLFINTQRPKRKEAVTWIRKWRSLLLHYFHSVNESGVLF